MMQQEAQQTEINYYLEANTRDAEAGMDKFDFISNGFNGNTTILCLTQQR